MATVYSTQIDPTVFNAGGAFAHIPVQDRANIKLPWGRSGGEYRNVGINIDVIPGYTMELFDDKDKKQLAGYVDKGLAIVKSGDPLAITVMTAHDVIHVGYIDVDQI